MRRRLYSVIMVLGIISMASYSLNAETQTSEGQAPGKRALIDNSLLDGFDDLLFVERQSNYRHICDQMFGFRAVKGGGLFILKDFKTNNPKKIDVVAGLKVPDGVNKGMLLSSGAFEGPDLSYDGKTIVFAWTSGGNKSWVEENCFSIFRVDIDGSNLKRLTNGNYDDFSPLWLPNGRIIFLSTRRGGVGRCHSHAVPTYTMYSMKPDGSDLYCIDWHETNEWTPCVDNDGKIIYSRWDYVDRDSDVAHHLWWCYPDGRDPRSAHGNYPFPLTKMPEVMKQFNYGNDGDGRKKRPWAEVNMRPIPNTAGKYVATATGHHTRSFGSLILIDVSVRDDNIMSQITRLTPEVPFPESETKYEEKDEVYGTAWPLSEDEYICNHLKGIYLLNTKTQKKELIYQTNSSSHRPIDPIPVAARPLDPVLPTMTCQGENLKPNSPNATITVMNVYNSDFPLPTNVKIKWMRMVQIFPKSTPSLDDPRVHYGNQGITRMSIGVVPVESDGSVYCKAPVEREIYFQLLDEMGMTVQSMRSGTYAHPGEQMSCLGCHEDKWSAPPAPVQPLATKRPPSEIMPEPPAVEPVSYYRTVKPVFDKKCAPCHKEKGKGPDMSYPSLKQYAFFLDAGGNGAIHNMVSGATRTIPGYNGARYSPMYKKGCLESGHHGLSLTDEEFRRITLWLDLSSYQYGAYHNVSEQQQGKLVWPEFDSYPDNPQGVENRIPTGAQNCALAVAPVEFRIAKTDAFVKITLSRSGDYLMILYSLSGRIVSRVRAQGPGVAAIPLRNLGRGVYLLAVERGEMKYASSIVLR